MWRLAIVAMLAGAALAACGGGGLSDQEEFAKLAERHREADFGVEYEVTVQRDPVTKGETTKSTWYQQGGRSRVDAEGTFGTSVVIASEDGSYRCSSYSNPLTTEPGEPACIVELYTSALLLVQNDSPLLLNWTAIHRPEEVVATRIEDREIAGQETKCFSVDNGGEYGPATTLCLSDDGGLLFADAIMPDEIPALRHTAVEVSREVPEGIFAPPYEVVGESELCASEQIECVTFEVP